MDPVAFSIGPVEIRWYGVMMALSMLVGAYIGSWLLKKRGHNGDLVWDGLFIIILTGVVGARLVYVFTNLDAYFGEGIPIWKVIAVWQGGLSFHGGIIAGAVATYLYFRGKEIPLPEVVDALALGVTPGIILVRIGNLMNGDILGYKWEGPWAMNFPMDQYHYMDASATILRHPTELYGLLVGVACVLVAVFLWTETYLRKRFIPGTVIIGFVITYSLVRCVIEEPFRNVPLPWVLVDPAVSGYGLLTTTQIASIPIILVAIIIYSVMLYAYKINPGGVTGGHRSVSRQAQRAEMRKRKKKNRGN